jgi:predicted phage terminase large subunit-like protein
MGFYGFVKRAWSKVEVAAPFVDAWHVKAICDHLEAVSCGEVLRLNLNAPPGMSKSLLLSALWPAWEWTWKPDLSYYFVHYSPDLALRDARRMRDLVLSDWYRERWPVRLLDEGAKEFRNDRGGFRFSVSIGQAGPGRHTQRVVIDDPIKPIETQGTAAVTGKELAKVERVFKGTLPLRLLKDGAEIVAMQRLHEKDCSGIALAGGGYMNLFFPMRNELNRQFATPYGFDPRRVEGELLCAELKGPADVESLERDLGIYASGQLQQNPVRPDGSIFKVSDFRYYTDLSAEKIDEWIVSCDLTFSDGVASDFVAFVVMARAGAKIFIVDVIKKQMTFTQTITEFLILLRQYPQIGAKLVENKANGPAMLSMLENKIPGLIARGANDKKVQRARAATPWFQAHNVYFRDGAEWLPGVVRSLGGFPWLEHDDDVDAIAQGLAYFVEQRNPLVEGLMSGAIALPGMFRH